MAILKSKLGMLLLMAHVMEWSCDWGQQDVHSMTWTTNEGWWPFNRPFFGPNFHPQKKNLFKLCVFNVILSCCFLNYIVCHSMYMFCMMVHYMHNKSQHACNKTLKGRVETNYLVLKGKKREIIGVFKFRSFKHKL